MSYYPVERPLFASNKLYVASPDLDDIGAAQIPHKDSSFDHQLPGVGGLKAN
jgi:hypothetical protein